MSEIVSPHRPAEEQQRSALRQLRSALIDDGFESREAVIKWLQHLTVYSYGQVPSSRFREFATEFFPDRDYDEGVVLAAFLKKKARTRPLEDDVAMRKREQWAADVITPVQDQGFRALRRDATEYLGQDGNDDPPESVASDLNEEEIGFRPALGDLHHLQNKALTEALVGLEFSNSRDAILKWGDTLVGATRGEPIRKGLHTGEFVQALHNHPSGDLIMGSRKRHWLHFRQWLLARFVLPAFNRAVQDLSKRSKEEPAKSTDSDERGPMGG